MKITKAELITVGPPMAMVFASKTGPIGTRRVIVKLHTEEGLTGVGEIDLVPAEWGHNPSSVFAMFEESVRGRKHPAAPRRPFRMIVAPSWMGE